METTGNVFGHGGIGAPDLRRPLQSQSSVQALYQCSKRKHIYPETWVNVGSAFFLGL